MSKNFKKVVFICIFCCLITLFLFPIDIFLACLKWQMERYFRNSLNASLTFEKVELKEGKIHFLGGKVQKKEEIFATFEAILHPKIDLKKREIGGKLDIDNLKIVRCKFNKSSFPVLKSSLNSFFKFDLQTKISGAELMLYDYSRPSTFFEHNYFDLSHTFSSGRAFGEIIFYQDPLSQKLSTFLFEAKGQDVEVTGEFSSDSFPKFFSLATYFLDMGKAVHGWNFVSGVLDGKMKLNLENGTPTHLQASLALSNVKGENPQLEILSQIDNIQSVIDVDFSSISGINGEFIVQGGKLALQDKPKVCVGFWDLNDLHSKISIKEGKLENSTLHANFLGLQGEVTLDMDREDMIEMHFEGISKEMYSFFPQSFQKGFKKAFPNDYMYLSAKVKKANPGLELFGFLNVTDEEKNAHHIDFGCHLGHVEKKVEPIGLTPLTFSLTRSMSNFFDQVKSQLCLNSKRLGWFRAKDIPIKKFLSPFLFKEINMQLSAQVDIDATFDERYLVLFYEGKDFHVDSPYFELKADSIQKSEAHALAVHCVDLEDFSHVGTLPLRGASYSQKNYGFHVEDADTILQFENETIRAQQVRAKWRGIDFKGNLEVSIHSLTNIDLEIASDYFSGPILSAMSMVSHFLPSRIWKTPLNEGNVEGFFNFKYHFSPRAQMKAGFVRGKMKDVACRQSSFSIEEGGGDFEYDYSKNTLLFNDNKGKISFSDKDKVYSFTMPKCFFTDFPFFQTGFALDVADSKQNLLQLVGETSQQDEGRKITILGDKCTLSAFQLGNRMQIDHFAFGSTEGDADIKFLSDAIEIEHLFCKKNSEREMVLSGILDLAKMEIKGSVEKIKLNLEESFKKSHAFKPIGLLEAAGSFNWELGKNLEVATQISYNELELGQIRFGRGGNLKCGYSTERGLELEGLELELPVKEELHKCNLGKIFYNFENKKVQLEGCDFSFSQEKLEALEKTVEMICPQKVPKVIWDVLKKAKKEKPIEGKISLEIYPDDIWVYLYLDDGKYYFLDKEVEIKNLSLIYDPSELNLWAKCRYEKAECFLHFLADSASVTQGTLIIGDQKLPQHKENKENALLVNWQRDKETGLKIQSVEGHYLGTTVSLRAHENHEDLDEILLKGKVVGDLDKISPSLWGRAKDFLASYSVLGTYQLEGELGFHKKDKEFYVCGMLSGKEMSVSGIQLSDFSSLVSYQQGTLSLTNCSLKDAAGKLSISQANLSKIDDDWKFSMEEVRLKELRFSKLRCPWLKTNPKRKSFCRFLIIPNFSLDHFSGILGKKETIKGSGRMEFTNLPKKTLFSNLLFLPTEITARIGLDLSNLIPVRGTIVYEIRDKKCHFLELKDVFSEGKRSRFYLAEQMPAWLDFHGNLNLKIKMKQYNLLMKLAEFFTISVKGTVMKPAYTLSNHRDDDDPV